MKELLYKYNLVDGCIIDYARNHNRRETLLYNNKLYSGISKPKDFHKRQYEINIKFILEYFGNKIDL